MVSKVRRYIFCFYFISLLGRLWMYLTKACKFWGTWNRNAFRHAWWWGLSSKDVPNEAFREKGFIMWRTCFQLQAVAIKAMRWVCLWYPNNKMAIVKQRIEKNVNKAERIVRCMCLLHNIIIDLEGTTHDHSFLQETSQIRGSRQARTNVSGRSFSRSSRGTIDVINAFNAYFNGPTAAILSPNQ